MSEFCCQMRARFRIDIVEVMADAPQPENLVDFLDFDRKHPTGAPVIVMRFCPFCGKPTQGPTRIAEPPSCGKCAVKRADAKPPLNGWMIFMDRDTREVTWFCPECNPFPGAL